MHFPSCLPRRTIDTIAIHHTSSVKDRSLEDLSYYFNKNSAATSFIGIFIDSVAARMVCGRDKWEAYVVSLLERPQPERSPIHSSLVRR